MESIGDFDVVIVGGGGGGATLAMVLARVGASVAVIERGRHPRFAIGESTVPTSTMGLEYLADTYDLPDLRCYCRYPDLKERGLTGYPKAQFWFGLHRPGEPLDPAHQAMFDVFPLGVGPDIHMLRSDVDAHLTSLLPAHGVAYRDRTAINGFDYDGRWATLELEGPDGPARARARLIFDATGHGAYFGRLLGLRDEEPRQRTNTRAIYGHFRGVRLLEQVLPPDPTFRVARDAGTQHHCFDGGWIWVIPFDDGTVSIGILLDRGAFPLDPELPVEQEWRQIIDRFPTVAAALGDATPTRPLVRTDRVQFSSHAITAPGVVLTPHAAGFIDPLFSTGLTQTSIFVARAARVVAGCLADDDFDHARFKPLERAMQRELELTDKLVSGTIASFCDFEVFRQYWQSWIVGTSLQLAGRIMGDHGDPESSAQNFGAASALWVAEMDKRHRTVMDSARPPLERAYALETFPSRSGSWAEQWGWSREQWRLGGPGLRTLGRIRKSGAARLFRGLLPAFLHADNPFIRIVNEHVHARGPVVVYVADPGALAYDSLRVQWAILFLRLELGLKRTRRAGWLEFSNRARALAGACQRTLSEEPDSVRAAAIRAVKRRIRGEVEQLAEPDPLLVRPVPSDQAAPPA